MENVHEIRLRCTNAQMNRDEVFVPIKKMLADLGISEGIAPFKIDKNVLSIKLLDGDDFSVYDADVIRDTIDANNSFTVVSYTYITDYSKIPTIIPIFSVEFVLI